MGYGTIKTNTELGGLIFVPFRKTVTIAAGTGAAPVSTTVTGTVTVPSGTTLFTIMGLKLGNNPLPYYTANAQGLTWVQEASVSSAASNNLSIIFRSTLGEWTNYSLSCVLVFKKS